MGEYGGCWVTLNFVFFFFRVALVVNDMQWDRAFSAVTKWFLLICERNIHSSPTFLQYLNVQVRVYSFPFFQVIRHSMITPDPKCHWQPALHLSSRVIQHPPYSPDLTPCDYNFFPDLKGDHKGTHFTSNKKRKKRRSLGSNRDNWKIFQWRYEEIVIH